MHRLPITICYGAISRLSPNKMYAWHTMSTYLPVQLDEWNLQPDQFDLVDIQDSNQIIQEKFQFHLDTLNLTRGNLTGGEAQEGGFSDSVFAPNAVIQQIAPQDRIYLVLMNTQYKGCIVDELDGWDTMCKYNTNPHISVWYNTYDDEFFIAMRGTSPFGKLGYTDIYDDAQIAFGLDTFVETMFGLGALGTGQKHVLGKIAAEGVQKAIPQSSLDLCNTLSITQGAWPIIDALLADGASPSKITIAGHSLGGRAAACLAAKYNFKRAVLFNAAAPPTNPLRVGLGPDRQIHYHIIGDLVSSHSDPNFMTVVYIDNSSFPIPETSTVPPMMMIGGKMKDKYPAVRINRSIYFDLIKHHTLDNFLNTNGKPINGLINADQYDAMWLYNATHFGPEWGADLLKGVATLGLYNMMFYYIAWNSPIPGCQRELWLDELSYYCSNWSIFTLGDNLNCAGRFAWNAALLVVLGPLISAFLGGFYVIAALAMGVAFIENTTTEFGEGLNWN